MTWKLSIEQSQLGGINCLEFSTAEEALMYLKDNPRLPLHGVEGPGARESLAPEPRFLIQCRESSGNYLLWWKADDKGYTFNVDEAGLYTAEEAGRICSLREIDVAWREDEVRKCAQSVVTLYDLRRFGVVSILEGTPAKRLDNETPDK
ncbi:MAG TPA: hypothetical protein VE954_27075 [Oligoflexus sp.]|uniref:hypothetical protein n=1 Tax=Oligoflexus sp. TaxID=1971216 RepID=UPI002D580273|nr:hypothetical protein [Oligoflexus sp.]HYX36787.1 hypothetical protein [Oligoflexus sp.]